MEQAQQDAVKKMIAAELAGKLPGLLPGLLGAPMSQPAAVPQTPVAPAPAAVQKEEPQYPPEVSLDEYEALMVEALGWRVEASEKTQVLLNTERADIHKMKNELLERCVRRLGIDVNTYNIEINSGTKRIKIQKRG